MIIEEAEKKKKEEKIRREERARALGYDLTSGGGPRFSPWTKGKEEWTSPRSARSATNPRMTPTPTMCPKSARGSTEKTQPPPQIEKTGNVLVISNHQKPKTGGKGKKEHPNRQSGKNPTSGSTVETQKPRPWERSEGAESTPTKLAVPKLNLEGVRGPSDRSARGGNKGKQNESKADGENWRVPSGRLGDDPRPNSARFWPMTPNSTSQSARRGAYTPHQPKRCQTPKSSKADLASSWRSTPRTDVPDGHHFKSNPQRDPYASFHERGSHRDGYSARTAPSSGTPKAGEDLHRFGQSHRF